MKLLSIHSDFIEFKARKKAFKQAEQDVNEELQRVEECLVIFTAVEKPDEDNISGTLDRYIQEINKIADQLKATKVVLYPYAHLSSNLASPKIAEQFLKDAQVRLSEIYEISRAPFGWYKAFTVACKGHPLSELSRQFVVEPEGKVSLKREGTDELFSMSDLNLTSDQKIAYSAAILTGIAVTQLYEGATLGGAGFYQEQAYIDISGVTLTQQNLAKIESSVKQLIESSVVFTKVDNTEPTTDFQKSIASDLGPNAATYQISDQLYVPTFNEPFSYSSQDIKSFELRNIASAYWKNNESNDQLTRLYLVAFSSPDKLLEYKNKQEEAAARSHLKIGKEQGIFVVSDLVGPGFPLLAPAGAIMRAEIEKYLWDLHKNKGYERVSIPHVAKDLLYKQSGHWEKFGEELFHVKGQHDNLVLKPMNCPHHIQIFNAFSYSYRDLPVRFFEPTTVYRDEKPGQLVGLSRVRSITQDDGHIFCRTSQIKDEVAAMVKIILAFYKTFDMDKEYWVSLSVRGEEQSKYLGTPEVWTTAETALEDVANSSNLPFKKIEGEAAFYGPKLDFMFKDAMGREQQLATIQLDFNLPERFDLTYMNEESKKERLVMIHRAISGSLERFMSVMIEHYAGRFPTWLNPKQVRILTINDSHLEYAQVVRDKLREHDVRVDIDSRVESMGKKVHDAQTAQVSYILTVGDKERDEKSVAIRTRAGEVEYDVNADVFVMRLIKEIKERG